jgi:DinB superfamily
MRIRIAAASLLLSACALTATAQMGSVGTGPGPAPGSVIEPSKAVDSALSLIEAEMMSAVKAMPAEKYSFAPSAAIFVPGQGAEFATVRTFGQQVAHVAQANYFFFALLSGLKPDMDVAGIPKLTKKDDIVAALAGSFAFGHKAIATLTVANAFEVLKTPEPGIQTRATFALFGVSHANDHYGQLVEYLRMNGIVPPASAK